MRIAFFLLENFRPQQFEIHTARLGDAVPAPLADGRRLDPTQTRDFARTPKQVDDSRVFHGASIDAPMLLVNRHPDDARW